MAEYRTESEIQEAEERTRKLWQILHVCLEDQHKEMMARYGMDPVIPAGQLEVEEGYHGLRARRVPPKGQEILPPLAGGPPATGAQTPRRRATDRPPQVVAGTATPVPAAAPAAARAEPKMSEETRKMLELRKAGPLRGEGI